MAAWVKFLLVFVAFHSGVIDMSADTSFNALYPILNEYVRDFPQEFRKIPEERRYRLNEIVYFLEDQHKHKAPWQITFISTNEASISQMAQAWSKAASYYFGFVNFESYSGGLKPERISTETIISLEKAGFIVYKSDVNDMEVYRIKYSYNLEPVVAFPKKIDHRKNPGDNFAAVIVDENADLNITNVKGTYNRLFLRYDDPIGFKGSEMEEDRFNQTCKQIAVEMFYVFSQLKKRLDSKN